MFWTDIGPNGGIRKSAMDGSATEIIVAASSDNLHHGIGIDEHDSRIYWTDLQTEQIESSKFDGSDRKTIKTSVNAFDVEIISDWIFWSDSKTRKIMVRKPNIKLLLFYLYSLVNINLSNVS